LRAAPIDRARDADLGLLGDVLDDYAHDGFRFL
jgi:hypothetical protein